MPDEGFPAAVASAPPSTLALRRSAEPLDVNEPAEPETRSHAIGHVVALDVILAHGIRSGGNSVKSMAFARSVAALSRNVATDALSWLAARDNHSAYSGVARNAIGLLPDSTLP